MIIDPSVAILDTTSDGLTLGLIVGVVILLTTGLKVLREKGWIR